MTDPSKRIKPTIILPTGLMSRDDIELLRQDGFFCVVECNDPDQVRFLEPPPDGYDRMELAAIELCRVLLRKNNIQLSRGELSSMYVDILMRGTRMDLVSQVEPVRKK